MKKKFKFTDKDFSRADWCEHTEGTLFSGGYAMIFGKNYAGEGDIQMSLEGRIVFLSKRDEHGFWDCYDRAGDLVIIDEENLMPISDYNKDDGSKEIDRFTYEARYGL